MRPAYVADWAYTGVLTAPGETVQTWMSLSLRVSSESTRVRPRTAHFDVT